MTIREEFERAFKDWVNITCLKQMSVGPDDAALWAAKWMAERCEKIASNLCVMDSENPCNQCYPCDVRNAIGSLAKELSNDH